MKKDGVEKSVPKKILITILKVLLSVLIAVAAACISFIFMLITITEGINNDVALLGMFALLLLTVPFIWLRKRRKYAVFWGATAVVYFAVIGTQYGIEKYNKSITIDTSPNIVVGEYLPFDEDSKIVRLENASLKLTDELPRIDGAAALFPVYSAFVNAVYPDTTELDDGVFEYNNTVDGYRLLAERETDIFIGAYPSDEQRTYAKECGTTFEYTPIGAEAFVFFVHKDNPVGTLTEEQLRGIYSGEITNWSEVGGKDEDIAAFQRNEGSGSQSMLKRFMGEKPLMTPPTEQVTDMMSGIIEQVADYKSRSNSIGFSFRYYVEGIIKNPDIKMIAINGIEPSAENIRNEVYPIITPVYAVTYKENTNENVDRLLQWILSEEGQRIINETGYVGI